ncbi:MAG TPA: DNA gyrase C-terminal beta-propeller domain-containing protein, partial [Pseudonocardiaceae bacterium]
GRYVLVATDGGYAKRTPMEDYSVQGRGGKGVLTIQYDSRRGRLVGALIVEENDEIYAITSAGGVIRTNAREVRKAGRQTKGVRLMNLGEGTTLVAIAANAEDPSDVSDNGEASDAEAVEMVEAVDTIDTVDTVDTVEIAETAEPTEETGNTDTSS